MNTESPDAKLAAERLRPDRCERALDRMRAVTDKMVAQACPRANHRQDQGQPKIAPGLPPGRPGQGNTSSHAVRGIHEPACGRYRRVQPAGGAGDDRG